jgi:hypothetical protein
MLIKFIGLSWSLSQLQLTERPKNPIKLICLKKNFEENKHIFGGFEP